MLVGAPFNDEARCNLPSAPGNKALLSSSEKSRGNSNHMSCNFHKQLPSMIVFGTRGSPGICCGAGETGVLLLPAEEYGGGTCI